MWPLILLHELLFADPKFPVWRDQLMKDVAEGRWHVDPRQVGPGRGEPSIPTVRIYGSRGEHLGTVRPGW